MKYIAPEKILLVSPILLGENVWKDEFDPEFNRNSVLVSKKLKSAYEQAAKKRNVHFLAASEYANPSDADQEHMDERGHSDLAEAIFNSVKTNWKCA